MRKIVHIYSIEEKVTRTKNGKLLISHRYNRVPLLCSHPGGVAGAGRIRLAAANVG